MLVIQTPKDSYWGCVFKDAISPGSQRKNCLFAIVLFLMEDIHSANGFRIAQLA